MRTATHRTHRAAVILSGAVAALLVGGATAPAAYAEPGGKSAASQGKKVGHAKQTSKSDSRSGKASGTKSGGDNRASSNKDGKGHNDRWQAQADPDGDENGGIDQPGGTGGVDVDDQDGNNGSGNDSDCEDDNRGKGVPGHCKERPSKPAQAQEPAGPEKPEKPQKPQKPAEPSQGSSSEDDSDSTPAVVTDFPTTGSEVVVETVTEVLGIERFATTASTSAGRAPVALAASGATRVTPAADATEAPAAGSLPDTGADAAMLALLAGGLAAAGTGTVLLRRGRAAQS
jgi:LPXTG-motif cell wall-anchored protein